MLLAVILSGQWVLLGAMQIDGLRPNVRVQYEYQKSSDIWAEKRTHGSLDRLERGTAEKTAEGIAKCDAALTKLTAAGRK
jgi:hypothetical protein